MKFGKHSPNLPSIDGVMHEQHRFGFENGYGASVVRGDYTYGGSQGLWELAVLDENGDLTYSTPITDDVIGWLSKDAVAETLDRIAALPVPLQPLPRSTQPVGGAR